MLKIKVKKLYLGKYVSVRDYLIEEAKKTGQDVMIIFGDYTMTIKHRDLNTGRKDLKQQASKFGDKVYYLIDYLWNPDKKAPQTEGQEVMFE